MRFPSRPDPNEPIHIGSLCSHDYWLLSNGDVRDEFYHPDGYAIIDNPPGSKEARLILSYCKSNWATWPFKPQETDNMGTPQNTIAPVPATRDDFYPQNIVDAVESGDGNWRRSATNVVNEMVQDGKCFSSGEVARCLRIVDPSLAFRVTSVGAYIREAFYNGQLPPYDTDEGQQFPLQAARHTEGRFPDRTPEGQLVFVYGPTQEACDEHDFEVCIPVMTDTLDDIKALDSQVTDDDDNDSDEEDDTSPGAAPQAQAPQATKKGKGVVLKGRDLTGRKLTATVTAESRLYVNRDAFELMAHLRGKGLRGGDSVYIKNGGGQVIITLEPADGAMVLTLEATRGRVKVPNSTGAPFRPGKTYELDVTSDRIVVRL